jgi:hypothetical protein
MSSVVGEMGRKEDSNYQWKEGEVMSDYIKNIQSMSQGIEYSILVWCYDCCECNLRHRGLKSLPDRTADSPTESREKETCKAQYTAYFMLVRTSCSGESPCHVIRLGNAA